MKHRFFLFLIAVFVTVLRPAVAESVISGDLPRGAALGFSTSADAGSLIVSAVEEDSAAAAAGVAVGDRLVSVNGSRVGDPPAGQDRLEKHDGDRRLTLEVERDGQRSTIRFTPPARPLETIEGVDSFYDAVTTSDGSRLRTIVTRPAGTNDRLPAMLFTQWVSCGSIEYRDGSTSRMILGAIASRAQLALVRVERSTSGDSEGPACHELDYDTEVRHYVESFDQILRRSEHIDEEAIVVRGSSLGSTTAPLVARELEKRGWNIAGVAAGGGGAVTYLERMINFDRAYLERRPDAVAPADIHDAMNHRIRFHYEYLVEGRHPDEVAKDSDAMQAVRNDIRGMSDGSHYGRPYAYHQQAAARNFLQAWTELDAKVWVAYGEFDQFEAAHGHRLIVDMVNRQRPGAATYITLPQTDHGYWVYPTTESAYANAGGVRAMELFVDPLVTWLTDEIGVKRVAQ